MPPGTYRNITGNIALSLRPGRRRRTAPALPLFLGSYPITPASDILHALAALKRFGVTHDPGRGRDRRRRRGARRRLRRRARRDHDLRPGPRAEGRDDRPGRRRSSCRWSSSTCSAAARRPACRPRPSRPTCCRRCSAATASRRCRSSPRSRPPTASTPRWRPCGSPRPTARRCCCSPTATSPTAPSRGGSRTSTDLPDLRGASSRPSPTAIDAEGKPVFHPYLRDPETLARPWAVPGTPGLEHRIGGIEKADVTGDISYDPDNHDLMIAAARRPRSTASPRPSPDLEVDDPTGDADVLVLGWGSTYGPIAAATRLRPRRRRARSPRPTCATSTRSRPTPARCCARYHRVLVPEMNLGQLALLLRAKYLVDVQSATPRCAGCRSPRPSWPTCSQAVAMSAERVTEGVSR